MDEFGLPPKQSTAALYRRSGRKAAAAAPEAAAPLQRQNQAAFIRSSNGVVPTDIPAATSHSAANEGEDDDDDDSLAGLEDAICDHLDGLEESLVQPESQNAEAEAKSQASSQPAAAALPNDGNLVALVSQAAPARCSFCHHSLVVDTARQGEHPPSTAATEGSGTGRRYASAEIGV